MTRGLLLICLMWSISMTSQSPEELAVKLESIDQIRAETNGGKLDFEKILENDGSSGFYLRGTDIYTREDYATFLWGLSVRKSGVKSVKEAIKLWTELKQKKPNKSQKKGLANGFNYSSR